MSYARDLNETDRLEQRVQMFQQLAHDESLPLVERFEAFADAAAIRSELGFRAPTAPRKPR